MKDLKPKARSGGKLEVAPSEPRFSRDHAPHVGVTEKSREGSQPFRPRFDRWERKPERKPRRRDGNDRMSEIKSRVMDRKSQPPPSASAEGEYSERQPDREPPVYRKPKPEKIENPLQDEFDLSASSKGRTPEGLPRNFTSPPLLEGLHASIIDVLGPNAKPTPIQGLSLKHLFSETPSWRQFLLASETGSGKSIAYLLPMLQHLKQSEGKPALVSTSKAPRRAVNPRALVLAPTHELSRQLSSFTKALLHNIKLRVLCVSRANTKSTPRDSFTASKMSGQFQGDESGEFEIRKGGSTRPVDVLVGTPNRLLEMVHGRHWDRKEDAMFEEIIPDAGKGRIRPAAWRAAEPEMGLENIEWVIVDEADVLFGEFLGRSIPSSKAYTTRRSGFPGTYSKVVG